MTDELALTAVEACRAGGRYLDAAFERDTETEYRDHDVKSEADEGSEARMLDVIRERHPDHAVYAEESGERAGEAPYRWIVDPLDGTNNFASGLPAFATAACVTDAEGPVAAAVHVPVTDDLYVATRGGGVRHDGDPCSPDGGPEPSKATVFSVVGHGVKRDERFGTAEAAFDRVDDRVKRRVESWSPTVHWGLLARGKLDGAVALHPDEEEQAAGELLASEAGLPTASGENWYVAALRPDLRDELVECVEAELS